jgi:hypothetical protein
MGSSGYAVTDRKEVAMEHDDDGMPDRRDTPQDDGGMIGSEFEEPGPGRDTSLTEPDPVAASTDQPQGAVAMSKADPMTTRLGSHIEGAGVIGHDVVAAEEGATQETRPTSAPATRPERDLAAEPTVDRVSYDQEADQARRPSEGG